MKKAAAVALLRPWPPARPVGPSGQAVRRAEHLWQALVEPVQPTPRAVMVRHLSTSAGDLSGRFAAGDVVPTHARLPSRRRSLLCQVCRLAKVKQAMLGALADLRGRRGWWVGLQLPTDEAAPLHEMHPHAALRTVDRLVLHHGPGRVTNTVRPSQEPENPDRHA